MALEVPIRGYVERFREQTGADSILALMYLEMYTLPTTREGIGGMIDSAGYEQAVEAYREDRSN